MSLCWIDGLDGAAVVEGAAEDLICSVQEQERAVILPAVVVSRFRMAWSMRCSVLVGIPR